MQAIQLPAYRCHKEVQAAKIVGLVPHPTDSETPLLQLEGVVNPLPLELGWHLKHKPEVGGYYVVYEDGYSSFSPAKAFEGGYTRVES